MQRRDFIKLVSTGALAVLFPARAQNPAKALIGILVTTTPSADQIEALQKGLGERGYVEGRNATLIYRSAEGKFDRFPALAVELVEKQVAAIVTIGGPIPARAAKAATSTIPIVFGYGGDPVADGLVASFNRPGGNVTGTTFISTALTGKRLELLREVVPQMTDVALLVNRKNTLAESQIKDAEAATRELNQRLHVVNASSEPEIEAAFEAISQSRANALVISTDPAFGILFLKQIVDLAARYKIPTIYPTRPDDGGLISYGASFLDIWHDVGVYAGRILNGEKPSDLPITQPTRFELIINLKTAQTLGLKVPASLLAVADEVIE
jgi:putative tryptophan/tyrosine transport system substrate-binding protein